MADKARDFDGAAQRIKELESPGMWQDFYDEMRPFGKTCVYKNDFVSWVADEWTITEVGTSLQNLKDERNGVLDLTSGGTEDNGNNCQLGGTGDTETTGEAFLPAVGKNMWFEAKIKSDDVTQHDFFVGLSIQDAAILASNGADMIGFITHDGDALLDFISNSTAGGASTNSGIHTLVDNTYVTVGFKVSGLDKIEYYVNGVLKGTSTNVPATEMKLSMAQLTGEGNAATLSLDYIVMAQDR